MNSQFVQEPTEGEYLRRNPMSVHEARVINNSVRIGPGRYRVASPPPYVSHIINNRPRRPMKAIGDGQLLGKHEVPSTSFSKFVDIFPPVRYRKRVYYKDDMEEEIGDEHSLQIKRHVRLIDPRHTKQTYEDPSTKEQSGAEHFHTETHGNHEMVHDTGLSEPGTSKQLDLSGSGQEVDQEHEPQYVDEVVDVIDEQVQDGFMPSYGREPVPVSGIGSISIRSVAVVKQLRGENNYLKEQLDASFYRIRQLEALLADKNLRIKQLVSETVQQNVNIRKLTAELGEHTAKEILERRPPPQHSKIRSSRLSEQ